MIAELVPTVVDLVEYQLPEVLNSPNNSQFIAMLKHYYEWLISVGQPTDFIQNILEYRDIDMTNPMFMQHLTASLVDIIPAYTKANKTLLTKHLVDFLKAKGSADSFKFIMNAIYGEDITMEWNSNKLFRASANGYSRTASLTIESTDVWENTVGAKVIQTYPTPASALITSQNATFVNGITVNWLSLDSTSVIGTFVPNGKVECIWNTINRAWFREIYYYDPISFTNHGLIFTATFEESRPYENLIIKQLNSDFRAVISTFVSRQQETGRTRVELTTRNETGSFAPGNQLYIFPSALENTLYTNTSVEYGTVSNAIVDVNIVDPGALYTHGESIIFQGGSGELVNGYIAEVTTGGIDVINISKKGYGYAVGDSLRTIDSNAAGSSAIVSVSSIDGIGAAISTISELNTISIVEGGSGFFINDELEVSDGISVSGSSPIRFRVSSVNSSWLFKGAAISTNGSGYPLYSNISLINSTTFLKIAGFSATPKFDNANGISSLNITSIPTISTGSLLIIANGYGATATPTIGSGHIAGLVSTNIGVNYIDPIVKIVGDGIGAIALPVMTNGSVTSFTIVNTGSGYTTATITISERYGSGFSAIPLIQNQTTGSGSITGLTILSRGIYRNIPTCFNNILSPKIGNGIGAIISMDMRLSSISIDNNGQYYQSISTSVSGIGKNAVLVPILANGVVSSINRVSGGTGYTYANISIVGGRGFIGTVTLYGGIVTGISIINGGSDYASGDSIIIMGDGTGASFNLLGTNNIINGVISSVAILNGGNSYAYNTSVTCPTSQIGAVQTTFTPVISNGVIVSVNVIGGHGYIQSDLAHIAINSGVSPTLNTTVSGTGGIVGYSAINTGYGYYSHSELTPLSILTSGAGTGALFLPSLDDSGSFINVKVLNGGDGYTLSSNIIVTGGNGNSAILKPVVFNGKITDVNIIHPGFGYKYGTYAIILGDGNNAVIDPVVETGITSVEIIDGGMYYNSSIQIVVTDSTGTGADIRATVLNGKIIALTIFNKGVGYINPTLTVSGYGTGAILTATAKRFISDLTITNKGFGYTYSELVIIGDGFSASYSLVFDKMGSIDSSVISVVGSGITSNPIVTITDSSGFGAVSGVHIISQGAGYQMPPLLVLDDKLDLYGNIVASGTKFTCYGSKIGGVKKVMFNHNGAYYNDLPTPIFPFVAVLTENAAFSIGETVISKAGTYRDLNQTNYTTMENSNTIMLEDGSRLLQDMDDVFFESGVTAIVDEFDFDRNIIELTMMSDIFSMITEDGIPIWTENEIDLVSQDSGTFEIGDVLIGLKSNSKATIGYSYRGNGTAIAGGNGWSEFVFTDEVGKLNNKLSVIADNNRYQDYAYVIKAGIALSDYEALLKATVHPAGYAMFGDIQTHTMVDLNVLNEIGYNTIATIMYIISVYSMYQSGTEWNDISRLYGDLTKFNYSYMPISNIATYQVQQVSNITFENYQEYTGHSITPPNIAKWYVVNNGQILNNSNISPDGSITMTSLADTSAISISGFSYTVSCNIGDTLTFEMIIGEQENPTTIPQISIGTSFVNFDPSSGEYTSSNNAVMDVILISQYWYLRIKTVAISTKVVAQILPAFSFASASGVSNVTAIGRFEATNIAVKNITGLTPHMKMIRAVNSLYTPKPMYIASTESQITIS